MDTRLAAPGRRTSLRGRAEECALLHTLLGEVRQGQSRSLVLRGESGIGKTALLEDLVDSASDMTVVRSVGVESEMELAYASLHQLCVPLLDRLERLPPPQSQALQIVFGLSAGAAPDRFLVGLGVLGLFSEAGEDRPLLCVVDDAQWLDQASALTVAFVARRLLAEPVGLVFAARQPGEALQHLSQLQVRGLADGDARELLASAVRSKLDERVRDRIIAETRGNPLALLELPQGLTGTQLAGGFGLSEAEGVPGRVEESFVRRLEALPEDTRHLLVIAAAEPVGDPALLWRAAERLGVGPGAAGAAQADGLLAIDERVIFRHPLVRSVIYRSSSPAARHAAHLALAHATDPEADPDRRAWHLAAAASSPDEQVALELERSAGRARARGGVAAAAAFLHRAVALTGHPKRRAGRALAAAEAHLEGGAFDTALRLIAAAQAGPLDEAQRARADLLRGELAFGSGVGGDPSALLLKAAKRLEPLNLTLARDTYLTAVGAALLAGPTGGEQLVEISRAARDLPAPGASRPVDVLLNGLVLLVTEGRTQAASTLRRAVEAFAGAEISLEEGSRWGWMATAASNAMWDHDGSRAIYARQIQRVRDAGALERLPRYLFGLGTLAAWSGDFAEAASVIAETDSVIAATGARALPYASLLLLALQGKDAEATEMIAATIKQADDWGLGVATTTALWAAAILHNGLGHYDDALVAAERASSDPFKLYASMWALPELVEAAARCGKLELARDSVELLAETTGPSWTEFARGIEARSRAVVSHGQIAEELYREAIERLGRTRLRPELARAHLLYGESLRRANRRVDARAQLRAAYEQFTSIGMEAFAARARVELLATGEKPRQRSVETRDDLTAQERQIARLACDGLSNPEIGARLFLSPRTVEWHLRKVFTKLGVRARRELADALPNSESDVIST